MKKGDDVVPEKPYQVICHIFSGRSRGFGFVTMSSVEEFEEVVCKFYGYELHGRALRVNLGPALPWTDESPFGLGAQISSIVILLFKHLITMIKETQKVKLQESTRSPTCMLWRGPVGGGLVHQHALVRSPLQVLRHYTTSVHLHRPDSKFNP
ncbi:hypothetical protein L1987_10563 [Smallanthus sonchifolius]|uniref:Uncharacterized protein n=1 Tax=Smallanthus sonchifolius TaxID=185202 RepID=A0ACB9JSF2_9ASTR|nr:hypothetical protein L1987_10563 [Smallanthus sonchifolius]